METKVRTLGIWIYFLFQNESALQEKVNSKHAK